MLTKDKDERKTIPLYRGLFQYFPAALAEVAKVSHVGNEQHNPGEDCFDNREKSNDDYDCMLRHLVEADEDDDDGMLHAAKVAWRALRACQKILEDRGAVRPAHAARWPTREGFPVHEVLPSMERIPDMHHREYYKFHPEEILFVCANPTCLVDIKAADTAITVGNKSYCSYACAQCEKWKI